jgi:hypothetical protein
MVSGDALCELLLNADSQQTALPQPISSLFSYYYGTFGMLFGVGTPISIKIKNYWPAGT